MARQSVLNIFLNSLSVYVWLVFSENVFYPVLPREGVLLFGFGKYSPGIVKYLKKNYINTTANIVTGHNNLLE